MTSDQGRGNGDQATGFRALNDDRDSGLTGTYVRVMIVEAAIIAVLLIFARLYS